MLYLNVRLIVSKVMFVDKKSKLDFILNTPEDILDQSFMNEDNQWMLKRAKGFGLNDHDVHISVIANRVCKFDNQTMP